MKVFREAPEKIFEDLKKRNLPKEMATDVIELDIKWRNLIEKGNQLRAKRNNISKNISEIKKKGEDFSGVIKQISGLKNELMENEKETEKTFELRNQKRMIVPNLLEEKVPIGKTPQNGFLKGSWAPRGHTKPPKPQK